MEKEAHKCIQLKTLFYPKVELAQEIVKSELLVSEDEDFINNFILSEDTLEEYKKAGESGGSVLGDVLLFSGSLAAVAGITIAVTAVINLLCVGREEGVCL